MPFPGLLLACIQRSCRIAPSASAAIKHACAACSCRATLYCAAHATPACPSALCCSSTDKGISGGQCKRVNIGIALISNPRVLFLVRSWLRLAVGRDWWEVPWGAHTALYCA